jgi:hypothetical protein
MKPPYVCDNCNGRFWVSEIKSLHEINSLASRLDPGSIVPSGECPDCGAFVYVVSAASKMHEELES